LNADDPTFKIDLFSKPQFIFEATPSEDREAANGRNVQ